MAAYILRIDLDLPVDVLKYVTFWPRNDFAVLYHMIGVKNSEREPMFAIVPLVCYN